MDDEVSGVFWEGCCTEFWEGCCTENRVRNKGVFDPLKSEGKNHVLFFDAEK
jgi:hypothetical protein